VSRARPLALAALALALALAAAACKSTKSNAPGVRLRQPAAVAVFQGYTLADTGNLKPYLAVANAARNDLSVADAVTGEAIKSPIQLTTLAIPVEERPSLLAAASLGDGKADLLVAVSAGDSVLQVVTTWDPSNAVFSVPGADSPAVDLGADVLALAVVPSAEKTARIAAALAGGGIALVEWKRTEVDPDLAIELVGANVQALGFQAVDLAAMPADLPAGEQKLYAATQDPLAGGLYGVAEISLDLVTVRVLGALAPTRLVAAARLKERQDLATAAGGTAFDGQPRLPRVYAVLDESACGPGEAIDCGIVTLDPALAGGPAIPGDWAGWMPYRAPMRVPGRPLALAVAAPPAEPPSSDPGDAVYQDDLMRLRMKTVDGGTLTLATSGVAAVASDDGNVYFLDLGRFTAATARSPIVARAPGTPAATPVDGKDVWLLDGAGSFPATATEAAATIEVTPGYTPTDTFAVTWQGILPDLEMRAAEAGVAAGEPWLALQSGDGPDAPGRIVNEVVRVWHPALGVRAGDVAVILAEGVPAPCVGKAISSSSKPVFEAKIEALLAPSELHPGGAMQLAPVAAPEPQWTVCYDALKAAVAGGQLLGGLTATIRAQGLVLVGLATGYAGRPPLAAEHRLEYPGKDAEAVLVAACTLEDWDGAVPAPDCLGACRDACEALVLARKARRVHHTFEDCATDPDDDPGACAARWPGTTFPVASGPALAFTAAVRDSTPSLTCPAPPCQVTPGTAQRNLSLRLSGVSGGTTPLLARAPSGAPTHASGAIAFDRSPWKAEDGYRFFVSYPGDLVFDVSPSLDPPDRKTIR